MNFLPSALQEPGRADLISAIKIKNKKNCSVSNEGIIQMTRMSAQAEGD